MSTDNFRQTSNDDFRPVLKVNTVAKLMKENPNKSYTFVRIDDEFDPNHEQVDLYESQGWSVEYSDAGVQDDRSNTKKVEESIRKRPITKNGKGKAQFVLMSVSKDKLKDNGLARVAASKARYEAASTGRKVIRKNGQEMITDSEVNESNMNKNSEV